MVQCSTREHATDLERRFNYLASTKLRLSQNYFSVSDSGKKKTRETYALGEMPKIKVMLLTLSKLNPHELHVQEVKRYQVFRETGGARSSTE